MSQTVSLPEGMLNLSGGKLWNGWLYQWSEIITDWILMTTADQAARFQASPSTLRKMGFAIIFLAWSTMWIYMINH